MAYVSVGDCRIFYEVTGREDGPPLLLSNSLGKTHRMWGPQHQSFEEQFRVITYDARGHGESDAPAREYSMQDLGDDVAAILDALKIERTHWCGVSIGGMTGLWFAAHRGDRVDRLVASNASAYTSGPESWIARASKVRAGGMASILPDAVKRWVTPSFLATNPPILETLQRDFLAINVDGYVGTCMALRDMDLREDIAAIKAPTLVVVGAADLSSTPEKGAFLASRIRGSRLVTLPAGHVANIEAPELFTSTVTDFLNEDRAD